MQIHMDHSSGSSCRTGVMVALPACSFHSSVVNMEKWCFVPCGHGVLGNGGLLPSLRCGDPSNHSVQVSHPSCWQGLAGKAAVSTQWPEPYGQDLLRRTTALLCPRAQNIPLSSAFPNVTEGFQEIFPLALLQQDWRARAPSRASL